MIPLLLLLMQAAMLKAWKSWKWFPSKHGWLLCVSCHAGSPRQSPRHIRIPATCFPLKLIQKHEFYHSFVHFLRFACRYLPTALFTSMTHRHVCVYAIHTPRPILLPVVVRTIWNRCPLARKGHLYNFYHRRCCCYRMVLIVIIVIIYFIIHFIIIFISLILLQNRLISLLTKSTCSCPLNAKSPIFG